MKLLGTDFPANRSLICFAVAVILYCACEGSEQRFVPTGLATGDNEIKQHRNFSEMHFSGVAACGFCLDGHDGGIVWDRRSNVCYPAGGLIKKSAQKIFLIFTDNVAFVSLYPLR